MTMRRRTTGDDGDGNLGAPIGEGRARRVGITDDMAGIQFEVGRMIDYVRYYSRDPLVVRTVEMLAHNCKAKDKRCVAETIFHWAKANFLFLNDPVDAEKIKSAQRQIKELSTPKEILAWILRPILGKNIPGSVLSRPINPVALRTPFSHTPGGDLSWVPDPKIVGDCVPLSQRVILRDRLTNRYVVREVGSIRNEIARYDALSYNFETQAFEFKPVVAWHDKGVKDVYEVKLSDGTSFRCTGNHNLFFLRKTMNNASALDMGPLAAIDARRRLVQSQPRIPRAKEIPALGSVARPVDLLWLEGLWVAEGWKDEGHVAVANKDPKITERVLSVLNNHGISHGVTPRKDGVSTVRIHTSAFKEHLRSGFGDDSFSKRFPEGYLSLPKEQATVLIDGYAAGDAYIPTHGQWKGLARLIHNTSSGVLASQLLFIHHLMGRPLSPYLQSRHGGSGNRPIWRLTEYIRDKAQSRSKEALANVLGPTIRSVTPVGPSETCDITVLDNGNFVTDQGIILKNCDEASSLIATLLAAAAIMPRFRFGGLWANEGGKRICAWHHVWVQARLDDGWHDLDVTEEQSKFGWYFPGFRCLEHKSIFGGDEEE